MNYKQTFEAYVREKCPELQCDNCEKSENDWCFVCEQGYGVSRPQLHHVLKVLQGKASVIQSDEPYTILVASEELPNFYLPLTPPSEWDEEIFSQLCGILNLNEKEM